MSSGKGTHDDEAGGVGGSEGAPDLGGVEAIVEGVGADQVGRVDLGVHEGVVTKSPVGAKVDADDLAVVFEQVNDRLLGVRGEDGVGEGVALDEGQGILDGRPGTQQQDLRAILFVVVNVIDRGGALDKVADDELVAVGEEVEGAGELTWQPS